MMLQCDYREKLILQGFQAVAIRPEASPKQLMRINDGSYTPNSLRLCATLDAVCFALCCVTHNARGAIFTDLLTSELLDSLCVDYLAQVTTPWLV